MSLKIVTLGEIMMRLTVAGRHRFSQASDFSAVYGGAEANVAISLSQWGCEVEHVSALPKHDFGESVLKYLRASRVGTQYIPRKEGRLGLYFLEVGAMQRASRIIYDRSDSVFSQISAEDFDWDEIMDGVDWFHWTGITPAISENALQLTRKALEAAKKHGVKVSADINYRRNLWQYGVSPVEVMPELISSSQLIVAGQTDLENCAGIQEDTFEKSCEEAFHKFPALKYITTTERNSISADQNELSGVLLTPDVSYKTKVFQMDQLVDRIGGGDAFIAGLIYGLEEFGEEKGLDFATAASVLKHSIPGDANEVSVEEVLALVENKNVGRLLR